jgi:hypothetical protein
VVASGHLTWEEYLRSLKRLAFDRATGVHHQVAIFQAHRKEVERPGRRPADNLALAVEERAVTGTVKLAFIFPPGDDAAQMGAALPQGQHAAIFKPGDKKATFLDVADGARREFLKGASHHFSAEAFRLQARLEKLNQRCGGLPE